MIICPVTECYCSSPLACALNCTMQTTVKNLRLPAYVGADYEMVQWGAISEPDDGSAAHEPEPAEFTSPADARPAVIERLGHQAEMIRTLMAQIAALGSDNIRLRALLSRVEDPPANPVQADIDRTIDHLVKGQTTQKQRKDLATATERADRDAAVGRALR